MTLEFVINELPRTVNSIDKTRAWQVFAERKKWRKLIAEQLLAYRRNLEVASRLPLAKCKCTFVRVSSREPDYDNMVASFKAPTDSLMFNGIIKDDHPTVMKSEYLWERARPKHGHIKITIEEVGA